MSRYSTTQFCEPPADEFICAICQDVLDTPLELPCRHAYCAVCIKRIEKPAVGMKSCPLCRRGFHDMDLKEVFYGFQSLLMGLKMRCENDECGLIVTLEDYIPHKRICDFPVKVCIGCGEMIQNEINDTLCDSCASFKYADCPLGCGETIHQEEADYHLSTSCELALIYCPYRNCNRQIPRNDFEHHRSECVHREILCPHGCGKMVPRKSIDNHSTYCDFFEVNCPFGNCEKTMLRKELEEHKLYCEHRGFVCPFGCGSILHTRYMFTDHMNTCHLGVDNTVQLLVSTENTEEHQTEIDDHLPEQFEYSQLFPRTWKLRKLLLILETVGLLLGLVSFGPHLRTAFNYDHDNLEWIILCELVMGMSWCLQVVVVIMSCLTFVQDVTKLRSIVMTALSFVSAAGGVSGVIVLSSTANAKDLFSENEKAIFLVAQAIFTVCGIFHIYVLRKSN